MFHEVLKAYDKDYDPNIQTRSQLSQMPNFKRLLESNHVQESEYYFEIRKYEEEGCDICKNIGRGIRTPRGDAWREVLRFMDLPVPNPMDKEHYLSPSAARENIDRLKLPHIKQTKFLPYLCEKNADASTDLVSDKEKKIVNVKLFQVTKICAIAIWNNYNVPQFIFSLNGIDSSNGPSQGDLVGLQKKLEYTYFCGDNILVEALVIKE